MTEEQKKTVDSLKETMPALLCDRKTAMFLSSCVHDLRAPLANIKGYAEAMRAGMIPADKLRHACDVISSEADRLTRMVDGLLVSARQSSGLFLSDAEDFDLLPRVNTICESFEGRIREKGLSLMRADDTDLRDAYRVNGHPNNIDEVLYNLLDNAVKYAESGKIRVSLSRTESTVIFSAENPVPPEMGEELERLHDFYLRNETPQLPEKTNPSAESAVDPLGRRETGFGMGHYIIRELLRFDGSFITVNLTEKSVCFSFALLKARPMQGGGYAQA